MSVAIFPVSAIRRPLDTTFGFEGVVHSYGKPYEQRIITSLPYGPREDGTGSQGTYPGGHTFRIGHPHLHFRTQPVAGNANLDNSVDALWDFYLARIYDSTNQKLQWEAFYWYDPAINDDTDTWFGDTVKAGTNSRGEAVTNETGRYLVRFGQEISKSDVMYLMWAFSLELIEVAE
jgi:hypothetical protein